MIYIDLIAFEYLEKADNLTCLDCDFEITDCVTTACDNLTVVPTATKTCYQCISEKFLSLDHTVCLNDCQTAGSNFIIIDYY